MAKPQKIEKKLKDIHFLVGLIMEYYRFIENDSIQKTLDNIQGVYDNEKENTI